MKDFTEEMVLKTSLNVVDGQGLLLKEEEEGRRWWLRPCLCDSSAKLRVNAVMCCPQTDKTTTNSNLLERRLAMISY